MPRPRPGVPWEAGTTENAVFDLNAIGYAFLADHRIRLGVLSAYWPRIRPQPGSEAGSEAGFTLEPIGGVPELPLRATESDPPVA
ncbi:hypothetical protein [Streptomyces sp. NPDC127066]|uniref:hypothetical protein n=1 Tax=Streptomyces sp. NPDC127066 TaxID=3347125 RepID=UPI00366A3022